MVKKIALWGLMAAFAGALVTGAVIRTTTISEQGGGGAGQRLGQSSEAGGQNRGANGGGQGLGQGGNRSGQAKNGQDRGGNGGGQGQGQGSNRGGGQGNSQDQAGNGGGQGQSQGQGQGQGGTRGGQGQGQGGDEQAADWQAFDGVVASVDEEALIVTLADGGEMIVEGRAWRYAQEQGFAASIGDSVSLSGFYDEAGDFEVGQIDNGATGQRVVLREETGRPLWAGSGGRGNP
jgi:hypothetical protein